MGGNALSVPTQRLDAHTYHTLATEVTQSLRDHFGIRAQAVPAYRTKSDFGDLDIVLEHDTDSHNKILGKPYYHDNLMEWAQEFGHAREFYKNNSTLSFDWRTSPDDDIGFQVDLLLTEAENFDATLNYFSYNDLGNLVGRIAHKMGTIYGHQGLLYPVMFGDNNFRTITISKDTGKILSCLGYDPLAFQKGFDTLDDVMNYAASSPYFNPNIYLLENRNHSARTRDRKRKTYQLFLEKTAHLPQQQWYQFPEDKKQWLSHLFAHFPLFEHQYHQALRDYSQAQLIKKHFNGTVAQEWTGLSGKELGGLMARVKSQWENDDAFAAFIEQHGTEGVHQAVMDELNKTNKTIKPKR